MPQLPKTGAQYLEQLVPDVFSYKTVLYIGATIRRMLLVQEFKNHGAEIDLLEIWLTNVNNIRIWNEDKKIYNKIICGDVRSLEKWIEKKYDVCVFWHGPEHLNLKEFEPTLKKMENFSNHLAIAGCPFGDFPQGPEEGNVFEIHQISLVPEDFHKIGWKAKSFGPKNDPWSYIISYCRIL